MRRKKKRKMRMRSKHKKVRGEELVVFSSKTVVGDADAAFLLCHSKERCRELIIN